MQRFGKKAFKYYNISNARANDCTILQRFAFRNKNNVNKKHYTNKQLWGYKILINIYYI